MSIGKISVQYQNFVQDSIPVGCVPTTDVASAPGSGGVGTLLPDTLPPIPYPLDTLRYIPDTLLTDTPSPDVLSLMPYPLHALPPRCPTPWIP